MYNAQAIQFFHFTFFILNLKKPCRIKKLAWLFSFYQYEK